MSDNYLSVPTLVRGRFRKAKDADAPRIYRGALPSATAGMRDELLANARQPEVLIRFLAEMDRKLDAVLSFLQSESLAQEFPGEGHIIELSGNGLVLECNHRLDEGSYIELLLMLEEYPMRIVSALSRIARARESVTLHDMHGYAYDVAFVSVAEEDREAVIRFVFSEERKRIRQQKGDI